MRAPRAQRDERGVGELAEPGAVEPLKLRAVAPHADERLIGVLAARVEANLGQRAAIRLRERCEGDCAHERSKVGT